ncbi:MAG: SRPBCC domain-containing protein [Bacteroidetes bacterium]|nr:SRPBCC domain-containing protein [Bacteroidota bacterium]
MEKLNFSTQIDAPREAVWNLLWSNETYPKWTSVFMEGSYAESDWKEGSKILFLGPDENGGTGGMTSRIAKLVPNDTMIFEHLGEVKNGVEDFSKGWTGAFESYFLLPSADGGTELNVELDTVGEYASYFQETFPKALAKVKELAEA